MRTRVYLKLMTLLAVGGSMMATSCLPENFWVGKWGEIVNGTIISAINVALGAVSGGGFQI